MNNLRYFREISGATPKQLARLISVTVHTYIAFEQERMTISKDVARMIAKIYGIDEDQIFCEQSAVRSDVQNKLKTLSELEENSLLEALIGNLTDGKSKNLTDREIRKIKDSMKKDI